MQLGDCSRWLPDCLTSCALSSAIFHLALICFIPPAVEEAIIALVRLYQKYTFTLSDKLMTQPLELKQGITISPKGGLPVTIVLRARASKQSGVVAAGA